MLVMASVPLCRPSNPSRLPPAQQLAGGPLVMVCDGPRRALRIPCWSSVGVPFVVGIEPISDPQPRSISSAGFHPLRLDLRRVHTFSAC